MVGELEGFRDEAEDEEGDGGTNCYTIHLVDMAPWFQHQTRFP